MIGLTHVRDRRVLILGLGTNSGGENAARWFSRRGALVTVNDRRSRRFFRHEIQRLRGHRIRYVFGKHRAIDVRRTDCLVQNPGVPKGHALLRLARARAVPIESDVSTFFAHCPSPIIGITGTKGKSTTAFLTRQFLRTTYPHSAVAGNIGRGVLDVLTTIRFGDPATVELSSWQLESLFAHQCSPHVAVITSITPDHLNRYPSFAAYAAVKRSIVRHQLPGDIAVLNADDPLVAATAVPAGVARWTYSTRHRQGQAFATANGLYVAVTGRPFRFAQPKDVHLPGEHMLRSVLAAALAAVAAGADPRSFATALRRFPGLPGRLETVRITQGVTFVNDTTATDPAAVEAGLAAMPKPPILIAGGVNKRLPYAALARTIRRRARAVVLLPGTASDLMRRGFRHWSGVHEASSMEMAVAKAATLARPGETVLLSPGAASFNLFLNEFDRGRAFTEAAKRWRL